MQVVLAVLIGPGGLPMGYHLYPGNTMDARTLQPALADVRRRHGPVPMAWISDAGMMSEANLAALAVADCDYIITARLRSLPRVGPLSAVRVLDTVRAVEASLVQDGDTGDHYLLPSRPQSEQHSRRSTSCWVCNCRYTATHW